MHISWSFLDKRKATAEAVEAYNSMNFIINHAGEEIQNVRSRMGGATSPVLDGMPHNHNPQNRENSLLAGIDEIDLLKERYRQAVEYMDWFKPAWEQLSDEERYVLDVFYKSGNESTDGLIAVMERYKIERSSAYNRKNRSLEHLSTLLYGKV